MILPELEHHNSWQSNLTHLRGKGFFNILRGRALQCLKLNMITLLELEVVSMVSVLSSPFSPPPLLFFIAQSLYTRLRWIQPTWSVYL